MIPASEVKLKNHLRLSPYLTQSFIDCGRAEYILIFLTALLLVIDTNERPVRELIGEVEDF